MIILFRKELKKIKVGDEITITVLNVNKNKNKVSFLVDAPKRVIATTQKANETYKLKKLKRRNLRIKTGRGNNGI